MIEDGYAWRKYGQKAILNTTHPRYLIHLSTFCYHLFLFTKGENIDIPNELFRTYIFFFLRKFLVSLVLSEWCRVQELFIRNFSSVNIKSIKFLDSIGIFFPLFSPTSHYTHLFDNHFLLREVFISFSSNFDFSLYSFSGFLEK